MATLSVGASTLEGGPHTHIDSFYLSSHLQLRRQKLLPSSSTASSIDSAQSTQEWTWLNLCTLPTTTTLGARRLTIAASRLSTSLRNKGASQQLAAVTLTHESGSRCSQSSRAHIIRNMHGIIKQYLTHCTSNFIRMLYGTMRTTSCYARAHKHTHSV